MSKIDVHLVQQLRERTGVGLMECKRALEEAQGDMEKAIDILRKKGAAAADKRASHATKEGLVHAYIHPGSRVGVLIEILCETDFVARTAEFKEFAQDMCLQIAAFNPRYLAPEDVEPAFLDKERAFYREELIAAKKPAAVIDQIVEGKLQKLYMSLCLLKQPFIKNDKLTVEEALKELISKVKENIKIKRFARFEVGQ